MRRLLIAILFVFCLSAGGCALFDDWWPFGGPGATYNSNTDDEASIFATRPGH